MPLPLPPNVYQLDAPPAPDTPPLDGSRRASVAIIGGGIVGLTTALHLAEAGTDVVVLEANEPGWGASGNNGGQLNPGLKFDPDTVEETWGPELGRRMVSFAWNTPTRALQLIERLGIACDAHRGGTLRVARSAKARAAVEATARQCAERGMPVSWLDRGEVAAALGTPAYAGAMLDRRGGNLNPLAYSRGLARAALSAGARIHGGTPANRQFAHGEVPFIAYPSEVFLGQVMDRVVLPAIQGASHMVPKVETELTLAALELAANGIGVAWVPATLARSGIDSGVLADLSASLPYCDLDVTAVRLANQATPVEATVWEQLSRMDAPRPAGASGDDIEAT